MLRRWLSLLLLGWCAAPLASALTVSLRIGDVEREGLTAHQVSIEATRRDQGWQLSVNVERLTLPGLQVPLTEVHLYCPRSASPWPQIDCPDAVLSVASSPWGAQQLQLGARWDGEVTASLTFDGLKLAGDRVRGSADWNNGDWHLRLKAAALQVQQLPQLAEQWRRLGLASVAGKLALDLQLDGHADAPGHVQLLGRVRALDYSDKAGRQAAQQVAADLSLTAQERGGRWHGALRLAVDAGELYSEPLFLDFKAEPLQLRLNGDWTPEDARLSFNTAKLDLGKALRAVGQLALNLKSQSLQSGELRIESDVLGDTYTMLLQPWLIGSPLGDLQVDGQGGARLAWGGGELRQVDLALSGVDAHDKTSGSGIDRLDTSLFWRAAGETPVSEIGLGGAQLDKLRFGPTRIALQATGPYFHLQRAFDIPFYGGHIQVPELTWVRSPQGSEAGFAVNLKDISLQQLTAALGWPAMNGTVNAELPRARLLDGNLRVAGDIRIRAFDGELVLRNLALDQLQSAAPVLGVDMQLWRLDLSKLTETFSMGRIQGRLDGTVDKLQLVGWQPNRFDAVLRSSPNDDLPHRISQRAVENLTELGNGVSGALSSSFLRIFDEFSYDRVELKVSQRGAVAELDGIPHDGGGYYIVKGAGIPRIDVIGRNHRIGWDELIQRLRSVRLDGMQLR